MIPRQARIDAPGALHHVIVRGIARRRVFNDDADRDFFVELNPLRAKVVADMKELGKNRYSGHRVLLGNVVAGWQNTKYILRLFGGKLPVARRY